ncbi:MAG: MerR family transcriptional regulator [Planctomycetota bacterium]
MQQVAELAGVSVRTLHHYHAIGLLVPLVDPGNGYRLYDRVHLLRLQQILVYRGLGFSLAEVKALLDDPGMDRGQALRRQRDLVRERLQADRALLRTLERTLEELEGGETMKDEDMFAGLPAGTEEQWNREVDRRWGDGQFEASRRRIEAGGAAEFRREAEDLREAIGAACREGLGSRGGCGP